MIIGWSLVGVVVVAVGALAWVGVRGWLAKGELEAAIPLANQVKAEASQADVEGASADAKLLAAHAQEAANLTSDPIWNVAEFLPLLGPNLAAVGEAADVTNFVAQGAIVPVVTDVATIGIEGFQPVNGVINLEPLVASQPTIATASSTLASAVRRVSDIDTDGTIEPVRNAVEKLESSLTEANSLIDGVNRAVTLVPRMLGYDGPRNYLLLFQNPAELRSGGGITSALALVGTDGGAVALRQQASGGSFPLFKSPVIELPADTRGIYGDKPAEFVQNTTLVPQFDLSGQIASAMWTDTFGGTVDGVMSFDPIALSYLLNATGAVNLPSGDQLTADNAVRFLLNDVYVKYPDPDIQDEVFASAAKAVFDRLSSGDIDARSMIEALTRAGDEGRFSIWSAHPDDQQVLSGSTLAGGLPKLTGETTGIGVFFNDSTGSKMDYYLKSDVATAAELCRADGRPSFQVQVTLTNTAPLDAASTLPEYVTGGGSYGVSPGNIRTLVYVYGPQSVGELTDATIVTNLDPGAEGASAYTGPEGDRTVAVFTVELAPGETRTMTVDFLGQPGNPLQLDARITPTIETTVYSTEINTGFSGCEVR